VPRPTAARGAVAEPSTPRPIGTIPDLDAAFDLVPPS
jgi:hypothetical protein